MLLFYLSPSNNIITDSFGQQLKAHPIMRGKTLPIWLTLLFLLTLTACSEKASEQQASAPPPEVGFITLKEETITLDRELPGRTTAFKTAQVRPQISGIIEERLFKEGEEVTQGQALYRIDKRIYQADHATAQANLKRAQSQLNIQEVRHKRMSTLLARKVVSQQEFDESEASVAELKAQISAAEAAVDSAKINLDYTTVRAPISGKIGRSNVSEGALTTANQAEPLATIRQLDPIYVDMTQSASALRQLRKAIADGQIKGASGDTIPVELYFEEGGKYEEKGQLQFAEVVVGETTGSVTLRALFPNPKGNLLPGMYVRAVTPEGDVENAILVPQKALQRDPRGNATVMVLDEEDKVALRSVVAQRTIGNHWLINEGLTAGDRVLLEGLQKVRPGAPTSPVELDKDEAESAAAEAEGN